MKNNNTTHEYERTLEPRLAHFDEDIVDLNRALWAVGITAGLSALMGVIAWHALKSK